MKSEWAVISAAPFTIMIISVLIFGVVYFVFKERLKSLNELLGFRDKQISDFEAKTGASTPEEAESRIKKLEDRINSQLTIGFSDGGLAYYDSRGNEVTKDGLPIETQD